MRKELLKAGTGPCALSKSNAAGRKRFRFLEERWSSIAAKITRSSRSTLIARTWARIWPKAKSKATTSAACFITGSITREGRCIEIPCQRDSSFVPQVQSWPVRERYGLVWIWAGSEPRASLPFVPELENQEVEFRLANRFTKRCHPNVMMINAIDAQHFNSVHNLPVDLKLEPTTVNDNCIIFRNTTKVRPASLFTRFVSRFYKDALTYVLCYWFGSTGTVTIGPDFLHFHIIFALRPTRDGKSEGQTILVTRKRKGIFGKAFSRVLLLLTRVVGAYFAKGDTLIFETIKFNFRTPIKADSSIIRFIEHVEHQRTTTWGLPIESER